MKRLMDWYERLDRMMMGRWKKGSPASSERNTYHPWITGLFNYRAVVHSTTCRLALHTQNKHHIMVEVLES